MSPFNRNAAVRHPRFGPGQVTVDQGDSVVVRFEHGIEECLAADLKLVEGLAERMAAGRLDPALHVVTRILGECIRSVNDAWGVFSRSRIALLPHQLWVCKRVLESWPTRWLVADDVGLGKTIEAGLILTPLLSSGRVRPAARPGAASLVEQWQVRLREMFDIRISIYVPPSTRNLRFLEYPRPGNRLGTYVASRQGQSLGALVQRQVLGPRAHRRSPSHERGGQGHRTLSYQLVERPPGTRQGAVPGAVHRTPHRGKDTGFLSLLKLLRPEDFNAEQPLEEQVEKFRTVMIRNNKQSVTDMSGEPVFTAVRSRRETYAYSPQEARFYEQLTQFIVTGKAYAAGLGFQDRRMVILVLITMQKLASSSVAAVRRALARRLARLRQATAKLEESREGSGAAARVAG